MANRYLQSLLGGDDYEKAKQDALGMGALQAGLSALMGSGPTLVPTSTGQVLGQAGMAGLSGYGQSMQQTEKQALQNMDLQQLQKEQQASDAFNAALPEVFKNGKVDYAKLQQLALVYPERVGQVISAYNQAQPPKAPTVNLQFDAKSGTIFNPRTGEVTVVPELRGKPESNPQLTTVEVDGKPVQRIIDLNTGETIADVGAKPATPKQQTDTQLTAQGYFDRMAAASGIIDPLEKNKQYPMYWAAIAEAAPFVGQWAKRKAMFPEEQQYQQAADDWIRAKLRKESGAVIGEEEMRREYQTYFPQPGDDDKVIEQKRKSREIATKSMAKAAGVDLTKSKKRYKFNPKTGQLEEQ